MGRGQRQGGNRGSSFPGSFITLADHAHGISTGWSVETRSDWPAALAEAARTGNDAVELSALSESELPGLLAFLASEHDALSYLEQVMHVSVHGPVKKLSGDWKAVGAQLEQLPPQVQTILMHPDTLPPAAIAPLRRLGSRIVLENMDCRKQTARFVDELHPYFQALPDAGFCLDVAHVWSVDQTMELGHALLDAFGARLREVHVSGIGLDGIHRETTQADLGRYAGVLGRCGEVPWILESPFVG